MGGPLSEGYSRLATLTPVEKLPTVSGSDKAYHLILIAILTLPIAIIRPNAMWIILSLTIAFDGAIELLQLLMKRNCGMADSRADTGGAVFGVLVARIFRASPRTTAD